MNEVMSKLEYIEEEIKEIKADIKDLRCDIKELKENYGGIKTAITFLKNGLNSVQREYAEEFAESQRLWKSKTIGYLQASAVAIITAITTALMMKIF